MAYVKIARFTILYYGLRAASADGELHPKELEAIHKLAKQLNVSKEEVQQIRSLINEENKLIDEQKLFSRMASLIFCKFMTKHVCKTNDQPLNFSLKQCINLY